MKVDNKTNIEVSKVYEKWLYSYLNGDVETYNSFLDDEYHFIGSAKNEEFLNRKNTTQFFADTGDEFAGKTEIRNETKTLEQFGELIFITHIFDGWFLHENDWTYYARFRFSSTLRKNEGGWRFIYQHFSIPDSKTEDGGTIGYDKINEENQELREAIQRRTVELESKNRELEIEGALQRIRAQAVAMKESADLLDIVVTMRTEFIKLGHQAHYFWHMMWLEEKYEKAMTSADGTKIGFVMELPRHIHGDIPLLAKWEKSKKPMVVYAMDADEAIDYVDKMINLGDFQNIDPQAPSHDDIRHINGLTFIMARTTHGEIGYSLPGVVKNPPKEDVDILIQFAGTFDLAHQRFLDLQKAEKQAKETQIELSLERIRSRVAEMKTSSDLFDVVVKMRNEFLSLGHEADYFWHMKWLPESYEMSMTAEDGGRLGMVITVPKFVHKKIKSLYTWEQSDSPYFVLALDGKEAWDYVDNMNTHGKYQQIDPHAPSEEDILHIGGLTFIIARTTHGEIGFSLAGKVTNPPKESIDTIVRFAKVFDLAYKRFEDLQKAETQARETQIELALEKVRSRTMAMQQSNELLEAGELLWKEITKMGIDCFTSGYVLMDENENIGWNYTPNPSTGKILEQAIGVPHKQTQPMRKIATSWKIQEPFCVIELTKKQTITHQTFIAEKGINFPFSPKELVEISPKEIVLHTFNFKEGYLLIVGDTKLIEEQIEIMLRFTKVFQQTYTRFLDLKKAEAQAREAQIETALERVRSRSMVMQKSDELLEAGELLYKELNKLGIDNLTTGYVLFNENAKIGYSYGVNPIDGSIRKFPVEMPHNETPLMRSIVKSWKNEESSLIIELNEAETIQHQTFIAEKSKNFPISAAQLLAISPDRLKIHTFNFKQGYLLIVGDKLLKKAEQKLIIRFAKAFQQTYTRFLDLQKAEAQAREAQIEAAVERVRAEAMAMHAPDDFGKVNKELWEQVQKLNVTGFSGAGILLFDKNDQVTYWDFSSAGNIGQAEHNLYQYDYKKYPLTGIELWNSYQSGEPYCLLEYDLKRLKKAAKEWESINPSTATDFKKAIASGQLTYQWGACGRITNGFLIFDHLEEPDEDGKNILIKMANAFELAYQRFLDLQKAQAQARESQIEAALEKVRSRTMAMQHSDELPEAANILFLEVQALDIPAWSCGYNILAEDNKSSICIMSSKGELQTPFVLPLTKHKSLKPWYKAIKNQEDFFVYDQDGKDLVEHYNYMKSLPDLKATFKQLEEAGLDLPTQQFNHLVRFNEGFLLFITYEEVPNAHDIFKRFGKVFKQTYTRFLDLQKAEAQAREAQIEAALERTRTQSMLMQHSNELDTTSRVFHEQLLLLGIESEFSYVWLPDESNNEHQFWVAWNSEKKESSVVHSKAIIYPLDKAEPYTAACFKDWESGTSVHVHQIEPSKVKTFFTAWEELLKDAKNLNPEYFSNGLYYAEAFMKYGCFGINIKRSISDEEKQILQRFSVEFERTYTRFLDLQKAEAQAREAKIEAALERVRSQSMGMQTSADLSNVTTEMFTQLRVLGGDLFATGIVFCDKHKGHVEQWHSLPDAGMMSPFIVPIDLDYIHQYRYDEWKKGTELFSVEIPSDFIEQHFQDIFSLPSAQKVLKDFEDQNTPMPETPPWEIDYGASFKNGYLLVSSLQPFEDTEILPRFAKVFEQTYTRFLDLQKAEAQAREAQIQLALERVRAKTMAMQHSDELVETSELLFQQIKDLGIDLWSCGYSLWYDDDSYFIGYNPMPDGKMGPPLKIPLTEDGFFKTIRKAKRKGDEFLVFESKGKSLKKTYQYMDTLPVVGEAMRGIVDAGFELPKYQVTHCGFFTHGHLMFITHEHYPEAHDIFKRFTKEFEQAYTRFLDLQKAEAQSRESQIQLSLERVRAKAMAMHNSKDIASTVEIFFKELKNLGIMPIRCGVGQIDEKNKTSDVSATTSSQLGNSYEVIGKLKLAGHHVLDEIFNHWKKQEEYYPVLKGKELTGYYKVMNPQVGFPDYPEDSIQYGSYFYFKEGLVYAWTEKKLEDEDLKIFRRFTAVIALTYRRYMDLQRAEEQAREAQIEAALEKVRSRSLAMHKPDELQEVVAVVAEKLKELGVIFDAGGVILCTYFPDNKDMLHWIAVDDFSTSGRYFLPYFDTPILSEAWESKLRGDAYFSKEFPAEAKNHFFEYAFKHSDYKHFPEDYKQYVLQAENHSLSGAWSKNSAIIIPTLTGAIPSESDAEIMKRFANVFEQAYIRFMDLQNAEARARESQIDIALERVRSRTMGMQKSDELAETSAVLFQQIKEIASETWSCGFCIWQENDEVELWMGADSGGILPPMRIPYKKEPTHKDIYEASLRKEAQYNKIWNGQALKEHYEFLRTIPSVAKAIKVMEDSGLTLPKQQCYYVGFFKHGYLLLITEEPNDDLIDLSLRFTNVFDLTYTRFLDLQLREKQSAELLTEKQRLEKTLTDLQQTQKQLIQSEKMASLGELTAGIAHEIQNPLNFVNNFSEVSNELMDEMNEEIEKGDLEEAKFIAKDIKQNLEKINHHGKRADAIVKGMLQHSRKSSAEKEPTDINKLADEYLRLAYHGLRAKDKSFNATLETDFDEHIDKVNVIPQDLGRVILNLITNAFYATNEKKKANGNTDFKPTVSVKTKKLKKTIEISVKDNGNGIPKHVVDKIFQPFFTTKPTGEGTGLGLSMSYDIVTKGHGGELKVETKKGKGTRFTILLPTTK